MCFGGGGSRTPEPRQDVREETKAAQKEEEEQKIVNRQKALDEEVETSAPVKTSLFYDTGGTVFRRKVGRGSLFTGSQGGSGFLSQGVQTTQTGLRRY
mgnify:FL=1